MDPIDWHPRDPCLLPCRSRVPKGGDFPERYATMLHFDANPETVLHVLFNSSWAVRPQVRPYKSPCLVALRL